ncbi:L-threonylcarbamoyladenylate synthase [Bradymonas sediminis]|uniref:L-threonylcarbamoyladenylate synthase n=1 Tax=Bradymonas sediminis TaxID=1548548 RepID=UPI0010EF2C9B|nr:L-threonylcarbamoyladenylate synthase [Bradymonas sediminis]TDP63548.1 translation factor SUA5 [Bradymonas sediminis]
MNKDAYRATLVEVDAALPDPTALAAPARALAAGHLAAFPTDTVYGLGANALEDAAVAKIFVAKGRPSNNPLIVHIADLEDIHRVVADFPPLAQELAKTFWPGALTLILKRHESVADLVSAGLDTVAVRMPAHPVARALIRQAGVPIAAPSANRYTEVSPTTAAHVLDGLGDAIDFVIDAGPTSVGLESTVLSLIDSPPQILRPGMITLAQIAEVAPDVCYAAPTFLVGPENRPSPGLARKHYSPRAALKIVGQPSSLLQQMPNPPDCACILVDPADALTTSLAGAVRVLGRDPLLYARNLYAALHELDAEQFGTIIVQRPPDDDRWRAIHDRLERAQD